MNDRFYLAILAGGALVLSGLAGCDAGDQGDPGSPDPESTAMYGGEETEQTDPEALGETQRDPATRPMGETTTDPASDPYATGGEQGSAVAGLESMSDQEVVGMTVVSREGEEIGSIEEVATEGGGVGMGEDKLAVVDVGGFLGIGEKSIAIPFSDLELSQDGRIQSDLTREALQSQPEYQGDQMGEQQQPDQTGQTGEQL